MLSYNFFVFTTCLVLSIFLFAILYQWRQTGEGFHLITIGAVTFFLFALMLENILNSVFVFALGSGIKTITESLVLYIAYGCAMAGIFEESGRYYAFKYVLKQNKKPISAIGYGLGHGGLELFLSGVIFLLILPPPSFGAQTGILWVWERVVALCGHISLSIIVFAGVHSNRRYLFPLAILLHAIADIPIGLYKFGAVALSTSDLLFTVCVLLCCFTAKICWSRVLSPQNTGKISDWRKIFLARQFIRKPK